MSFFRITIGLEDNEGKRPIKISHPGAFSKWCKQQGYVDDDGHVTCECICAGLKSKSEKIRKRANFAYTFGFKEHGKTCDCVEEIKKEKEEN